jgi:hypothetical protein
MPRHKQITTCRKSGGPSKGCSCEHCALSVCSVCGAGEGTLTTDCPGARVDHDRQQEVYETNLDYTDTRGWHLMVPHERRSPHFERALVPPETPPVDPRTLIAPGVDWAAIDRNANLQHELALRAIAWVIADRACDDCAARELHAQKAAAHLHGKEQLDERDLALLAALEREKIDFHLACQRVERYKDEFHQAGRRLVAALEEGAVVLADAAPRSD